MLFGFCIVWTRCGLVLFSSAVSPIAKERHWPAVDGKEGCSIQVDSCRNWRKGPVIGRYTQKHTKTKIVSLPLCTVEYRKIWTIRCVNWIISNKNVQANFFVVVWISRRVPVPARTCSLTAKQWTTYKIYIELRGACKAHLLRQEKRGVKTEPFSRCWMHRFFWAGRGLWAQFTVFVRAFPNSADEGTESVIQNFGGIRMRKGCATDQWLNMFAFVVWTLVFDRGCVAASMKWHDQSERALYWNCKFRV